MIKRLTLGALLALAGCQKDNSASIEIFQTCYPPAPANGICAWPATCGNSVLGTYVIDVSSTPVLSLGVQLNNQLLDNSDESAGRVNTNNAFIDRATVDYAVTGAAVAIPGLSGPVQFQNTVPAEGSAVVVFDLINLDATTQAALQTAAGAGPVRIEATARLHGVLGDQSTIVAGPRRYAIDVCAGCLGPGTCAAGSVAVACPSYFQYPKTEACVTP